MIVCQSLHTAVANGHIETVRDCIARGDDVNAMNNGWTPLHVAAFFDKREIGIILIDAGAKVDAPSLNGTTPILVAAARGHDELVAVLLEAGANFNSGNYNFTPSAA